MSPHLVSRPSWLCAACGEPWPCSDSRENLTAEHLSDPVALRVYLAAQLADAAMDLPDTAADALYGRFLGWLR